MRPSWESGCEGAAPSQGSLDYNGPSRLSRSLSLPPAPASQHCVWMCPRGTGGANTGSERLGARSPRCPHQPPHPHRHPQRLGEDELPFCRTSQISGGLEARFSSWRPGGGNLRCAPSPLRGEGQGGHWAPPGAHRPSARPAVSPTGRSLSRGCAFQEISPGGGSSAPKGI